MSITDPTVTVYYERRQSWILIQGKETFYDENRNMREWDSEEEALDWLDQYKAQQALGGAEGE